LKNSVRTKDSGVVTYDYLVVATGVVPFWERVKGLKEAIGKNGVASNYSYEYVNNTWEFLKEFKGGVALFTFPNTPVKCGGGPQKIMWLAEDLFRNQNIRESSQVIYVTAGATMFPVKHYSDALVEIAKRRDVDVRYNANLVEVRGDKKEAVFATGATQTVVKYDFLHVTPPMGPIEAVRTSLLADAAGFVDVDKNTLQHKKYPNVFALGDNANVPTSKTAAAITQQAPVVAYNLVAQSRDKPLIASYNGYTACPILTTYKTVMLAEFLYDGVIAESLHYDQRQESLLAFGLKKHLFPFIYWNGSIKGRWFGPKFFFNSWRIPSE